jgi:hypothetical protein
MQRFLLRIEGPAMTGVEDMELPRLPREGDPLETSLGSCIVTSARLLPEGVSYAGKIACRLRDTERGAGPSQRSSARDDQAEE